MKILVIDVESTCWDGPIPSGMRSEIIEIGYCLVEGDYHTSPPRFLFKDSGSIFVKPSESDVDEFCTELTGITREKLAESGVAWPDAINLLNKQFNPSSCVFASWGDYDRKMFERMHYMWDDVPYSMGPHLNLKSAFMARWGKRCGVAEALRHVGLEFRGKQHSGQDDAINIARLIPYIFGDTYDY